MKHQSPKGQSLQMYTQALLSLTFMNGVKYCMLYQVSTVTVYNFPEIYKSMKIALHTSY